MMRVVDDTYTGQEDEPKKLLEAIQSALEASEVDPNGPAGTFFMMRDTEDSMSFVTNETNPAEVLMLLEIVKSALIGAQ